MKREGDWHGPPEEARPGTLQAEGKDDGRKELVTTGRTESRVGWQDRSDSEHFSAACNFKGMKWSWVHATNNRALTTVREGDAWRTFLPDNSPDSVTSKQGSCPEQTPKEEQRVAVKAKRALVAGEMEQ